ncbi:MAG: pantoate--beta-alanine ligase [Chloroflexales bacterium]|nr:pantoate--beta-alanine ligase [Chloroflexales bacterium]
MITLETIAAVRAWRAGNPVSVGLVPTMGALHDGHMALVRRARAENERVAVSIFVNPAQFAANEDLARYPRDLPHDLGLLQAAGADVVFTPQPPEIYPPGFNTWVNVESVTDVLEGARRPGHFRGVATVVCKLFTITQPTRAYFGQKDAQQCVVVRRMVRDLNLPLDVVICPITRAADGLALSSRNVYLSAEQRQAAPVLHRALREAELRFAQGERDANALRAVMQAVLAAEPLARVDYISVADADTLAELATVDAPAVASLAVYFGTTRLIDNTFL